MAHRLMRDSEARLARAFDWAGIVLVYVFQISYLQKKFKHQILEYRFS